MRICSYLIFHDPERAASLRQQLSQIPGCESSDAAENVTVLVTETANTTEEHALQDSLGQLSDIGCLVQTFGTIAEESA